MWKSVPIQIDGILAGAAVPQQKGVRFVAIDLRMAEMDQTLWPTADDARKAAEQLLRTGRIAHFTAQSIDG